MRIVALALTTSLLLAAPSSGQVQAASADTVRLKLPRGTLAVYQRGGATVMAYTARGSRTGTIVTRDRGISPGSLDTVAVLATMVPSLIVLSTRYASRPGAPMGYCGAGSETVLRVVALAPRLTQTFAQRTESCLESVEAGAISIDGHARTLSLERIVCAPGGCDRDRTIYRVDRHGQVTRRQVTRVIDR